MTDSKQRGRITREFTVWCGRCYAWQQESFLRKFYIAKAKFIKDGWKYTDDEGWLCPCCANEPKEATDED